MAIRADIIVVTRAALFVGALNALPLAHDPSGTTGGANQAKDGGCHASLQTGFGNEPARTELMALNIMKRAPLRGPTSRSPEGDSQRGPARVPDLGAAQSTFKSGIFKITTPPIFSHGWHAARLIEEVEVAEALEGRDRPVLNGPHSNPSWREFLLIGQSGASSIVRTRA